jgi:nucleotide-binding universal stress UspA family protein
MISIKKILVPTDLSTVSVPAIGYAGSLAKDHDAEIVLFHVIPTEAMKQHFGGGYAEGLGLPLETQSGVRRQPDVESMYETKKQILLGFLDQKIGADLRKTIKVRPLVKLGKVVDEIIAAAKEEKCDLIVMTSQGGGLRRLFGGTITERVVRHAPCPVLSMQLSAEVRTEKDERLQVKLINRWAA